MVQSARDLFLIFQNEGLKSARLNCIVHPFNHLQNLLFTHFRVWREIINFSSVLAHVSDLVIELLETFLGHQAFQVVLLSVVIRLFKRHARVVVVDVVVHLYWSDFRHFENEHFGHIKGKGVFELWLGDCARSDVTFIVVWINHHGLVWLGLDHFSTLGAYLTVVDLERCLVWFSEPSDIADIDYFRQTWLRIDAKLLSCSVQQFCKRSHGCVLLWGQCGDLIVEELLRQLILQVNLLHFFWLWFVQSHF